MVVRHGQVEVEMLTVGSLLWRTAFVLKIGEG